MAYARMTKKAEQKRELMMITLQELATTLMHRMKVLH
jgi:hypothetical protein